MKEWNGMYRIKMDEIRLMHYMLKIKVHCYISKLKSRLLNANKVNIVKFDVEIQRPTIEKKFSCSAWLKVNSFDFIGIPLVLKVLYGNDPVWSLMYIEIKNIKRL